MPFCICLPQRGAGAAKATDGGRMPFRIIRDDITRVRADAIVNTANPDPVFGRGTDYAVYKAAGAAELLAERRKIGVMQAGEVCATPAFHLSAKYIFHTVGPGWTGGKHGELDQLASCYRKSLMLAVQLGIQSIAFPLIATGINGFPKDKALETALETIRTFLEHDELDVTLVVFNKDAFVLSSALARSVDQFIDDNYAGAQETEEYGGAASPDCLRSFQAMRTMVREGKADARTAADMNALDGWLGQLGDDAVLKECYGSGRGGQFFDGRAFEELSTEEKGMARSIARQEMLAGWCRPCSACR